MKILLVIEFIALTAAALWKHDWFAAAAGVLIPAAALVRTLFVWDKARRTAIVDVAAVLRCWRRYVAFGGHAVPTATRGCMAECPCRTFREISCAAKAAFRVPVRRRSPDGRRGRADTGETPP